MSNKCHFLATKGKNNGHRCGENISKLDPEARYCARHRICVLLVEEEKIVTKSDVVLVKYTNYLTFCESLVSTTEDLAVVAKLFQ